MKKNIIRSMIFVLLVVSFIFPVLSQNKQTNYQILGGLSFNSNIYSSNFRQLPQTTCCNQSNFQSGFGLGLGFFGGGEYIFNKKFLGINWRAQALFGFDNRSGTFKTDEFIGKIIQGNTYAQGISEHTINTNIKTVSILPSILAYPFEELPIGIKFGFNAAFPLIEKFDQVERLKSPSSGVFYENHQTTRNSYNGNIANASSMIFGMTLAARYEIYHWKNFTLIPEISFDYCLNNVVKSIYWKAHSLNASVALAWRVPTAEYTPPIPPPAPKLPEPPKPEPLSIALKVFVDNKELNNNESLEYPITEYYNIMRYAIVPVIYFDNNNYKVTSTIDKIQNEEDAQNNSLTSVIAYLKVNPDVNLKITVSSIDSEVENIADKRINSIKNELEKEGITPNRFNFENVICDSKKLKHTEMADEYRYARFDFSDKTNFLYYMDTLNKRFDSKDILFTVMLKSDNQSEIAKPSIKVNIDNKTILNQNSEKADFQFNKEYIDRNSIYRVKEINFEATASDFQNSTDSKSLSVTIKPILKQVITNENQLIPNSSTNPEQYILGLCPFDRSDFNFIDRLVLGKAKTAIAEGDSIEILPLCDSFGEKEHNSGITTSRANVALKLLGGPNKNIKIISNEGYIFSNDNPRGRSLNRSVVIRIIKSHK
jgi:hypothetical protein